MLRSHKRLSKKELKQDRLVLLTAQAVEVLSREWPKILGTVVGVALVIAVALFIVHGRERSEQTAYETAIQALLNDAPEAPDLLDRFVSKYGGSSYAQEVLLELANYNFAQGNYMDAQARFQQFIDEYGKNPLYGFHAYNGLGGTYEELGNLSQAATTYEEFTRKFSDSPFMAHMLFSAGRAYFLAGDYAAAERNFSEIVTSYNESTEYEKASFYLDMIEDTQQGS